MDLFLIFLTGLTIGGLTCMAVQGSLLASLMATREKDLKDHQDKSDVVAISSFLTAKLLSHIMLGFLLGLLGQTIALSDSVTTFVQFLAGLYVLAIALHLLEVHPIFRHILIQPPKFITKKLRNQSKSTDIFAPFFLGFMTIFIPCGTTLAISTLAISSQSAIQGALIMGAFTLGTLPLFFGLGYVASVFGHTFKTKFIKIAGILLVYFGLTSINGALTAWNFPVTYQKVRDLVPYQVVRTGENQNKEISKEVELIDGIQKVKIVATPSGYSPMHIKVQAGVPVELELESQGGISCASQFRVPSLSLKADLFETGVGKVAFTPEKKGKIPFSCSMGMYTGVIEVI